MAPYSAFSKRFTSKSSLLSARTAGFAFALVLGSLMVVWITLWSAPSGRTIAPTPTAGRTDIAVPPAEQGKLFGDSRQARKAANAFARVENVEALVGAVAKKYRVSHSATREFVDTAFAEARHNRLDPLLVIAVIAIESRFNPVAQSDQGATGLMQVIPRYHADKFSAANGETVLDPHTNIKVGAQVLKEYIVRGGNESAGLQLYNGSSDAANTYAAKVMAERRRLLDAMQRGRPGKNVGMLVRPTDASNLEADGVVHRETGVSVTPRPRP